MGDKDEKVVPVSERFRLLEEHVSERLDRIERRLELLVIAFRRMGDATEALTASLQELHPEPDDPDTGDPTITAFHDNEPIGTIDSIVNDEHGIAFTATLDAKSEQKQDVPEHLQRFVEEPYSPYDR